MDMSPHVFIESNLSNSTLETIYSATKRVSALE